MRNPLTVAACLGLLLTCAGGTLASPQGKKDRDKKNEEKIKLAELDDEFQLRVNDAVGRGISWLLSRQAPDGRWPTVHDASQHGPYPHGGTALSLLALLKSGHPAVSDEVAKGIKFLLESWNNFKAGGMTGGGKHGWKTYEVGITLMMLEAMASWRPQGMKKGHTFAVGKAFKPRWAAWVKELRDFLLKNIAVTRQVSSSGPNGGGGLVDHRETWSYPSGPKLSDHSNTQYAILGLHSAAKLKAPTPAKVWRGIFEGFIFTQAPSGPKVNRKQAPRRKKNDPYVHKPRTVSGQFDRARGWSYNGAAPPQQGTGQMAETGSMTTVGLACVAIAWHNLGQGRDKAGRKFVRSGKNLKVRAKALDDGFAWLDKNWDVTKNPNYGTWHYYYLYGMERAGIMCNRQMIGGHDWYREGGELILSQQRGSMWDDGNGDGPVASTCFAILFLTRATVPLTAITRH